MKVSCEVGREGGGAHSVCDLTLTSSGLGHDKQTQQHTLLKTACWYMHQTRFNNNMAVL